ncbi:uncharacterized protein PGTG_14396 [Puccinia graminis f. sp. tritici CRL 75-36-700-3]|uniref:3-keto sterol reductase n=1 Tax=Puccinia graminis f. sp. tritici (strain CRL 75-36-700-3 / race SCCL) TaxID=418459 RepID=E3KVH2_PUCGT|nr:uncharacterized protein PGTG_14396 [Puccinia graminis f. sp. tritici CRL 75-36-700-3]EFP88312.1 hypothetical protein PGTG_14396 [Puccinia graminis f. sp. tritici CRL 75-36-700-3]
MRQHEDEDPKFAPRPVVLITGGTGAVGHGICLRLLYQLSQPFQLDLSSAYHLKSEQERREEIEQQRGELDEDYQSIYGTPNGLTLLVGCRSESKCRTTQIELEKGLRKLIEAEGKDEQEDLIFSYIDRQSGQVETMTFYEYRSRWLDQLTIEWVPMDLYHAQSVVDAVKLVNQRYGYLTHLLLNAGGGPFVGIDWIGLVKAFLRNFLNALTYPDYLIQAREAKETVDGIPETWQLNVFSHYLLARESLPLLAKGSKRTSSRTRIIWTGSLDGQPAFFDRKDLECFHSTAHAYQSTKYQSELVGQAFQDVIAKHGLDSSVVSLVAHPGVVAGNMFLPIIGRLMDTMMRWVFYFARLVLGSPHHLIDGYLAALVWTKLCLTTDHITNARSNEKAANQAESDGAGRGGSLNCRHFRFGAQCNRWGRPYVVLEDCVPAQDRVDQRLTDQRLVVDHCDRKADALMRLWAS